MKKIIAVVFMAIALSSCRPIYLMGGHTYGKCAPVTLPPNIRGWDYRGGVWYDRDGNVFGYALEEDSVIYRLKECL